MNQSSKYNQGFSLIEVVVVSAIAVMVFGALFSSFQYSLGLLNLSQAKLSAQSVANDRMEFFRSLPYDEVGTIGGIPPGSIPQNSTTTLNGIDFHERVLVEYVDDPADGTGSSDENGIPADYKRVKVEYTWEIGEATSSIALISNIVPKSIETTDGGGTAKINVLDADSTLLSGADVRLINNNTTSTIDVTRSTNVDGVALFSGAPAASGYEVIVTANKAGQQYSVDKTYVATSSNPSPDAAPFSVLEGDVSTMTFQIGELSDLEVTTLSALNEGSFIETFADLSAVASSSGVEAIGDELRLASSSGSYEISGQAYLGPIEPTPLQAWESLRLAADAPAGTAYSVRFYTGSSTGPWSLIPDEELTGNSTGFTGDIIDISGLDPTNYPSIYLGISLTTTDDTQTAKVEESVLYYRQTEVSEPSVSMNVHGNKRIGKDNDDNPIYKYDSSVTTDAGGELTMTDMEFDNYTFVVSGYDMATACGGHPFSHQAGADGQLDLLLVADSAHSLRTVVENSLGDPIPGALVRLERSGYDTTKETNICGQVFFSGMDEHDDYVLTVTGTGYQDNVVDPLEISGDVSRDVILNQ